MDILALYSRNCKSCSSLDPEEAQAFEKCHYSRGNKECPAQEVQLAVVGEAKHLARSIKKARAAGDINKEVKILKIVAKRNAPFQSNFKEWSSHE